MNTVFNPPEAVSDLLCNEPSSALLTTEIDDRPAVASSKGTASSMGFQKVPIRLNISRIALRKYHSGITGHDAEKPPAGPYRD